MNRPARAISLYVLASALAPGCYLSHERGRRDAGPEDEIDAGASIDASARSCCRAWAHTRRVRITDFERMTITPRLIRVGDRMVSVITGPEDSVGPSGAHAITWERDLSAHGAPVALTTNSFTWGQPASDGSRFGVCWTAGRGQSARLFDMDLHAISAIVSLEEFPDTPCTSAAYAEDRFAFGYAAQDLAIGRRVFRVRLVDALGVVDANAIDAPAEERQPTALAGVRGGFVTAVSGDFGTRVSMIDARGRPLADVLAPEPARSLELVPIEDGGAFALIAVSRGSSGDDAFVLRIFEAPSLSARGGAIELGPAPSARFASAPGSCGEPLLATGDASLGAIEDHTRLRLYTPPPIEGTLAGDTSVLAIEDDVYVAFSSTASGDLDPQVSVDYWRCTER